MRNTNKKIGFIGGLFIAVITFIAVIFHYPISIIDALTLEHIPEYGIHIPIWKIIFEPFLGLVLFFNRAVYTLEEQQFLLLWILLFFIGYSLIRAYRLKEKTSKKKFILRQVGNFFLSIGLWFTFFIIMVFMSAYLPNNTIINNAPNRILIATHSHTQMSHDGLIRPMAMWEWQKRNGFDAFFITNHNRHDKTIDLLTAQRNGAFSIDPLIMCGEEFSGSNHLSLLGLKRKFDTHGYADSTVVDSVYANQGVVIVNHWFDGEHRPLSYFEKLGVDGFEIENSATETSYNREQYHRLKSFCESNNMMMVAGLDFHGYGNVCTMWNALEIPNWHEMEPLEKESSIIDILKTRDQSKLQVLIYKDRPFYTSEQLFWTPLTTIFNYFRTLNTWQLISWAAWVLLFVFMKIKVINRDQKQFKTNILLPIFSVMGALFMLALAWVYYAEIQQVLGSENDVYEEYSQILFIVGLAFLLYSVAISWLRIKRSNE